jgi:hypothetical protein
MVPDLRRRSPERAPWRASALILAISAMVAPTTGIAQVSVELGPLVAAYAPLGSFRGGGATALPRKPSDLSGPAWGAQGRVWLRPRVGIQLQAVVASSRFGGGGNAPGGPTTPKDAQVVTLTAQLVYRPLRRSSALVLTAGAGVVRHGGEAYDAPILRGLNPLALALGVGTDLHVGHWLTATLGVTALLYQLDVHDGFYQHYEGGFQADLLPHVTLAWGSRRR